jgi:Fe-S cluster biogenesis protein NfuA/nitrite reductase/ring-hydroxylating ferredoxin subunit
MEHGPAHDADPDDGVPPPPDLRATGERIDALIESIAGGGAGPANPTRSRERAEDLVRAVTDLYGAGLERLMDIVYDSGRLDEELLGLLAEDDLVASLLLVHGLHPHDVPTRVENALESVRPYLGSHGGDVELLEVSDEGAVRLRLLGSCDGCPSSSVTLELAVQDAIEAAAPEVTSIEVESPPSQKGAETLIPVDSLRSRLDLGSSDASAGASWHTLPEVSGLAPGQAMTTVAGESALFVCQVGQDLFAFRNGCARCAGSLEGAVPVRRLGGSAGDAVLTCPGCGAHYDVRRAGACIDEPELHLDPLPLLVEGTTVSVAVPAAVGV